MRAIAPDITLSGQRWQLADEPATPAIAVAGLSHLPYARMPSNTALIDANRIAGLWGEIDLATTQTKVFGHTWGGDLPIVSADHIGFWTIQCVSDANNPVVLPGEFLDQFQNLSGDKQLALLAALQRIKVAPKEIEFSEDGQIIIETRENGRDCFYAICTRDGDFKGTWLDNGTLRREPWSVTPPFAARTHRAI